MGALDNVGSRVATPQGEPVPGKPMVANSAGGYVFAVDPFDRLRRFLVLGAEGGTYYVDERKHTLDNAAVVSHCLDLDAARTVATIVEVSDGGLAPKNDPALFALAMALAHPEGKRHAEVALPKVARIGTHLFHFAAFLQNQRGWGPVARRAVARWYEDRKPSNLALQAVKYRQRDGWTHRDLLRLAHPRASTDAHRALYDFICGRDTADAADDPELRMIEGFLKVQATDHPGTIAQLIRSYRLPREALRPEHLNLPSVWAELLVHMPITAMIRNLGVMTARGVLARGTAETAHVVERLTDAGVLADGRVHPLSVLLAHDTYAQGHGVRGKLSWSPVPAISDALDAAFYAAFGAVEPAGKRTLLGLDISASMGWGNIAGTHITPRVAAAAMAMVTSATEPDVWATAFTTRLREIDLSARRRLDDVIAALSRLPHGGTDCSLPMVWAKERKIEVDTFVVYTDNETWAGRIHPFQALREYREASGLDARLVVVGLTSTGFTIADPNDAGMLDVVGFDASAPGLISGFSAGKL